MRVKHLKNQYGIFIHIDTVHCALFLDFSWSLTVICNIICILFNVCLVGYTTDDLRFMWQSGDPVQMDEIALPQFDIKQEDIEYGNCTKFYAGTGKSFPLSMNGTNVYISSLWPC